MMNEVKLKMLNMFKDKDKTDRDYSLGENIAKYMDGETAYVIKSAAMDNVEYLFLGLKDKDKDKELHYMIEQDSMIGTYIDDREGFDKAWDNEEYEPDGGIYLKPEEVELLESEEN